MQDILHVDPLLVHRVQRTKIVKIQGVQFERKFLPIHDAVIQGHPRCLKFLLENGADLKSLPRSETYAMLTTMYDAQLPVKTREEILEILLGHGAVVNVIMMKKYTFSRVLYEVLMAPTSLKEVEILLKHGACTENISPMTRLPVKTQPIKLAFVQFKLGIVKLFLLYGAHLRYDPQYRSPNMESHLITPQDLVWFAHAVGRSGKFPSLEGKICTKFLEAVRLYQAFGGNMWVKSFEDGKNILEYLDTELFAADSIKSVMDEFKQMIMNPMSLKGIARAAVRNIMGRRMMENIEKLEIPRELENYLRYQDIYISDPI
jgi:hypothetical protein